jgi:hypothetical protein
MWTHAIKVRSSPTLFQASCEINIELIARNGFLIANKIIGIVNNITSSEMQYLVHNYMQCDTTAI